jgi:hypothetical protein
MKLILLVCALVCFAIKGLGIPTGQIDLMNIGFALVVASLIV